MGRGGKRKGAGRKRLGENRLETVSVRVSQDVKNYLQEGGKGESRVKLERAVRNCDQFLAWELGFTTENTNDIDDIENFLKS